MHPVNANTASIPKPLLRKPLITKIKANETIEATIELIMLALVCIANTAQIELNAKVKLNRKYVLRKVELIWLE